MVDALCTKMTVEVDRKSATHCLEFKDQVPGHLQKMDALRQLTILRKWGKFHLLAPGRGSVLGLTVTSSIQKRPLTMKRSVSDLVRFAFLSRVKNQAFRQTQGGQENRRRVHFKGWFVRLCRFPIRRQRSGDRVWCGWTGGASSQRRSPLMAS